MSVDLELLLYSLAKAFNSTLNLDLDKHTLKFIKKIDEDFNDIVLEDKIYYYNYAGQIMKTLVNYLDDITVFELKDENDENKEEYDFKLTWGEDNDVTYISMHHNTICVKDILPVKLMKVCQYRKNTTVSIDYKKKYNEITKTAYKKIKDNKKYSEVSNKTKNTYILEPVCELVYETINKKKKCAKHLYEHIFNESNRIVFTLYKFRFIMYDFGKDLGEVETFKMKLCDDNLISLEFNNGTIFNLKLDINSTDVKKYVSLKFKIKFDNMDDLFLISKGTIKK